MKLLNYTTAYFAGILLLVIAIWAGIFYYAMLNEIYDSIDDGLDNQKGLVIQKAAIDPTILTQSNFDEKDYAIIEISPQQATQVHDTYSDTSMYMQNEKDYEPVRLLKTVFNQNGKHYQLSIATSMVEEDDLTKQLLLSIIWLYVGLVIVILLLNNILLKRIWNPFYHLLSGIKKFRIDKPAPLDMKETRIEEFQLLNQTVNKMAEDNAERFSSQKQFIENASHELQTPLAITINKMETLAETGNLSAEQLKLVGAVLDNLERMTNLNKSLLLLSRIENRQFHAITQVDLVHITRKLLEDFEDQVKFNGLTIELIENADPIVEMDTELATVLVTNLVKNAIIHTEKGGFIRVIINRNSLEVQNSGDKPLEHQKIFDRFYHGNNGGSTGLGLAIARAIAQLYHFTIRYEYKSFHNIEVKFS